MVTNYRIGPNRILKTLNTGIQDNVATVYLDPQATKYTNTVSINSFFRCPTSIKGCINDQSFNSFTGINDPNFVGIDTIIFGPTVNEIEGDPIVFEGLYFDDIEVILSYQTQTRVGSFVHIIFNRCMFFQGASNNLIILEKTANALIEFRHCWFKLRNKGDMFYFFNALPEDTNTVNIHKSIIDVNRLEHHIHVGCFREINNVSDLFQHRDYVRTPTIGYGPGYGTNLISNNSPKIAGHIYKNNQPVIRNLHMFDRYGRLYASQTSTNDGYYEIDLWTYDIKQIWFILIEGIENEKSVVLEHLKFSEHTYTEL